MHLQQSKPTRPHLWRLVLNESAYLLISSIRSVDLCSGRAFATPAHYLFQQDELTLIVLKRAHGRIDM